MGQWIIGDFATGRGLRILHEAVKISWAREAPRKLKLHHAAALALVGWYLMVPPFHYDPRELWAPVSQWKIAERFNTATACEGYLQGMKEDPGALHGEYKVASKFQTEGLNTMRHMRIDPFALRYAGCMFSDDPRLDEN